jgi:hypothetical protein
MAPVSAEEVRQLLRRCCEEAGSQTGWARKNDMSGVYVSDVLAGRRDPGGKLLAALGLERVVHYRQTPKA